MALKTVLSSLLVLAVCLVSSLNAGKFTITVRNEIDDKDDPICLKALDFTIGKVIESSCELDAPVGKEFKIKVDEPANHGLSYGDYLKYLEETGKKIDSITLGNGARLFMFTVALTPGVALYPVVMHNIRIVHLAGWSPGFFVYPL